jgi:hypothetical protein
MKPRVLLAASVGVVSASVAMWLFPRAMPIVGLRHDLTRDQVLARADSFFRVHDISPANARTAVRFQGDDSLRIFVELGAGAGGHDSLNALVRGRDIAPFAWTVRAFRAGDPREAHVDIAPDGRVIGFDRRLAEADIRPNLPSDSARRVAEQQLHRWITSGADSAQWRLVSTSTETRKVSGRVDHSFTFERTDRRIGGAPIRADVTVAGDLPAGAGTYVEIPESFERRYAEMRSWNAILAAIASLGILLVAIAGVLALTRYARGRGVRWREPMVVGAIIGLLTLAAGLNELPGSWFWYDTAMSATTHLLMQLMAAAGMGVVTALMAAITLAAAEVATRHAFPQHLDWWKLWRYRGTKEVAHQVGGGYVVATIAFAYVALFYLVTRTLFGWWVPSEVLDDPNLIATPLPWMAGIAISLNAGVWEEALFRALPLSLLSLFIGQRPKRAWWMVGGAVVTALVFGFAHSDYASWPPYSRGVEIFLDALFWAFLFVRFGLLMTVVAHFVYDAVLFGIFAASGSAPAYRISAAIILLAILAPALVVLWRRVRQGRWVDAPPEARFVAWEPTTDAAVVAMAVRATVTAFSARSRQLAMAAAVVAAIIAVGRPPAATLGPDFTVSRERVLQVSDSMLRAHGADPEAWRRLTLVGNDTLAGWERFQRQHRITDRANDLARTFHPATWWVVRYVHTTGSAAERTEEWRMRVWPDGRPLDVRHIIPDSAARDTAAIQEMRRAARTALARAGVDTSSLRETDVAERARPARRDVTITFTDTSVKLPAGAEARAWVHLAGNEPLVARRGLQLPEDFLRADTEVQSKSSLVFGITMMAVITFVVVAAIVVKRRRAPLVNDGALERGHVFLAGGALMLLMMLSAANSLPSQLYGYDTSEPWSTFMGMTAFGFVASAVFALVVAGLWMVLDAMRRRVGIPIVPEGQPQARASEVLLAGLGIGGVVYASNNLVALMAQHDLPDTPRTSLDTAIPMLEGIADIPGDALMTVAMAGIPLLVIAALTRRWVLRAAIVAVFVSAVAVAGWATRAQGDIFDPGRLAAGAVGAGLVLAVLVRWGPRSAASWLVAALAHEGFQSLRAAVHQTTGQEQIAGLLNLLTCALLVWLIVRVVARQGIAAEPMSTAITSDPF